MGFRNPFRMSVDKPTGIVYVGDYGPDAGAADPNRGPAGQVEFARVTKPGNFGWPYCTGDNDAYIDYDFATGDVRRRLRLRGPEEHSPHNTGLDRPAARRRPPGSRTTAAPCPSSAPAPSPRWAARSTTTTRRSTPR